MSVTSNFKSMWLKRFHFFNHMLGDVYDQA
jgi:hypothetical protein